MNLFGLLIAGFLLGFALGMVVAIYIIAKCGPVKTYSYKNAPIQCPGEVKTHSAWCRPRKDNKKNG